VLEAQIAYGRALQSANVDMFQAWINQTASEKPERPSVEIKRNEVLAA
jgi:redox-sensitive bicupin YhaK (pirin superfamily)